MSKVSIKKAAAELDTLSEEERRALRISRFHAQQQLPPPPSSHEPRPRLAHPGGPLATNKAAALAKFLKRKLDEPGGASKLDPALVERAVHNAKATALAGQEPVTPSKAVRVRHVNTFSDSEEEGVQEKGVNSGNHVRAKNKKKKNKSLKCDPRISTSNSTRSGHNSSSKKKKKNKKKKS